MSEGFKAPIQSEQMRDVIRGTKTEYSRRVAIIDEQTKHRVTIMKMALDQYDDPPNHAQEIYDVENNNVIINLPDPSDGTIDEHVELLKVHIRNQYERRERISVPRLAGRLGIDPPTLREKLESLTGEVVEATDDGFQVL